MSANSDTKDNPPNIDEKKQPNESQKTPVVEENQRKAGVLIFQEIPGLNGKMGVIVGRDSREQFSKTIEPLAGGVERDESFSAGAFRESHEESGGADLPYSESDLLNNPKVSWDDTYSFVDSQGQTVIKNSEKHFFLYLIREKNSDFVQRANKLLKSHHNDPETKLSYKEKIGLYFIPLHDFIGQLEQHAEKYKVRPSSKDSNVDWSCRFFTAYDQDGKPEQLQMSRYYFSMLYPHANDFRKGINELAEKEKIPLL